MDEEQKLRLIEKLKKDKELALVRRAAEESAQHKSKMKARFDRKCKLHDEQNNTVTNCEIEETQNTIQKRLETISKKNIISEEIIEPELDTNDFNKQKNRFIKIKAKVLYSSKATKKMNRKSTSTERSRKCRAKMTEQQIEEKRRKDRERYKKKKEANIIKGVKDLSKRDQRKKRSQWRTAQRNRRTKLEMVKSSIEETPPNSDNEVRTPKSSKRGSAGRKKMKAYRTKIYRDLQKAKMEVAKLKSEKEKFKKRYQRLIRKKTVPATPSPNTKVDILLKKRTVPHDVRRQLLFAEALKSQIEENVNQMQGSSKEQQCYKKVLSGKVLKKYRLQGQIKNLITYKQNRKWQTTKKILLYERKSRKNILSDEVSEQVTNFFERDDVSRMCPGKKEFKRKGPIRKQKRLLMLTMKEAYRKYMQCSSIKMSYPTFRRGKPFWVTPPTKSDRETCLCIKHENFGLLVAKMNTLKMFLTKETHLFNILKEDKIEINVSNTQESVSYHQWQSRNEERLINEKKKILRITSKNIMRSTKLDIAAEFFKQLPTFREHVRNIKHQYKQLRQKKEVLSQKELVVQIDFSENYCAKLHSEIQSMHFGANKKQLSLHTGVLYYRVESTLKTESFTTVSENLDHQCHAVWGHLIPILRQFVDKHPQIDTIHFFSDGPTSQYKNRFNLYLLVTILPEIVPNFKYTTWNFSESGHGKGPMDGVGGSLKRQADDFVLRGGDIVSASDFVTLFKESQTTVVLVDPKEIEVIKNSRLTQNVKKIPNITKLHQVVWEKNNRYLYLRELSCFECSSTCIHFGNGKVDLGLAVDDKILPVESHLKVGEWIAAIYDEKWFPGE